MLFTFLSGAAALTAHANSTQSNDASGGSENPPTTEIKFRIVELMYSGNQVYYGHVLSEYDYTITEETYEYEFKRCDLLLEEEYPEAFPSPSPNNHVYTGSGTEDDLWMIAGLTDSWALDIRSISGEPYSFKIIYEELMDGEGFWIPLPAPANPDRQYYVAAYEWDGEKMTRNGTEITLPTGLIPFADGKFEYGRSWLLKVDLDPVYGDGPDGIGYCPSSIGDGLGACTFVGSDYEDLNIGGSINQIPNPAAIVIENSSNDGNVAVFMIETDMDDSLAENVYHWEIDGGSASFYPPGDDDNNKGKVVKISGSTPGRIKIKVYAGEPAPNIEPATFTEAEVVYKKTLPYRANILTYDGNTEEVLPSSRTEIQNSMKFANIILRQAGIELVQSSNTEDGDTTFGSLIGDSLVGDLGDHFFVEASNQNLVEEVAGLEAVRALTANYIPGLLQINFIESFKDEPGEWTWGRNPCRPQNGHQESSRSEAYKTSKNDIFDESIEHTLILFESYEPSEHSTPTHELPFPSLYGFGVAWEGVEQSPKTGGYTIAHEALHAMNLRHREGEATANVDGLPKKYRGPDGTNIMDYGGGVDLDLLQALIARGSPLLQ